jgi:hypothetical protein
MAYEDLDDYSVGAAGSDTFDVVIPDLDPSTSYPIQFRWQFADKTVGLWSVSKTLNTPEIARPESTNIVAQWVTVDNGIVLQITWDAPELANGFVVYLTSGADTVPFGHTLDKSKTEQKIIIPAQNIRSSFSGVLQTNLTGLLKTTYIDTSTSGSAFVIPPFTDALNGAAIADTDWLITAVDKGVSVSWNAVPTSGTYWETVVYKSSTQNGTYVAVGSARNAPVIVEEINTVWIKIRHRLTTGGYSAYSNAKEAKAYVPIVFDTTPPNEVTVNSAVWSGDNIVITYTMPATDPASRFKITLTNGTDSGDFYEYPGGQTGTHTITLYDDRMYQQIGERYSSYTGNFISIDASENPTSGTSFSVGTKTNPLQDVTPDFTVTAISNGYVAEFSGVPAGVSYIKVYAKSSSFGAIHPVTGVIDSQYLVYTGVNPGFVVDTDYNTKYIKARYFTISGQFSNWSAEKTTKPLDAGQLSAISNPVTIQTGGSILAGDSLTTGARLLMNEYGIFLYDYDALAGAAPSTQIIGDGYYNSSGVFQAQNTLAPTFITERARIANWMIYSDRFENALSASAGTYTGLSAAGDYAIWAGGNSSKNTDGLAKFSVTHAGAVTARNISIIGGGTATAKLIDAGSFFVQNNGYIEATNAKITGEINASTGVFKGPVDVGTADIPAGQLRVASTGGTILIGHGLTMDGAAAAGITATNTGGTQNFWVRATDGYLFSQSGKIGGWSIGTSKLSGGGGTSAVGLQIDSTAGGYAFWAGAGTPDIDTPFSVTNTGILRATGAIISGSIKATSGFIGSTNGTTATGFNFNSTQITSVGTPSGSTAIVLDGSTGTISGGLISGSIVRGSVLETAASGTRVKIDGPSKPGTIQLFATGFPTAGIIDVSGSWSLPDIVLGNLVITPPIATGHSAPSIVMYSDVDGGWAGVIASTIVLGDSTISTSGGRMDGSWEINVTDGSATGISAATRRQVRNISAWQGSGPPSGTSFNSSQIGDIVLFYT